ncbi:MAG: hypothetical protein ACRDP9_20445 [Kribbellaceae bacterium]
MRGTGPHTTTADDDPDELGRWSGGETLEVATAMSDDHSNEWYFCLKHHTVEPYQGCASADRLGPYGSPEEASRALEKVEERNEEWDNDPRWNDD